MISRRSSGQTEGLERKPALYKYKMASELLEGEALSEDDAEYARADALIAYRHYLVHFKPRWTDERRQETLENRLRGQFPTSQFLGERDEFLSMQCMTAGCADWAARTVVEFVRYFAAKSGLPEKYDRARRKLRPFIEQR